jgi:hypothetical protein
MVEENGSDPNLHLSEPRVSPLSKRWLRRRYFPLQRTVEKAQAKAGKFQDVLILALIPHFGRLIAVPLKIRYAAIQDRQ